MTTASPTAVAERRGFVCLVSVRAVYPNHAPDGEPFVLTKAKEHLESENPLRFDAYIESCGRVVFVCDG
jgi:hypothetical protein